MIPLGVLASARVAAGGPLVLASDDFDRADSTTVLGAAQIGGTWDVTGTWGIQSSQARSYANGHATLDIGRSADFHARVTIAGQNWPALNFRYVDANNRYFVEYEGGRLGLYRYIGGARVTILNSAPGLDLTAPCTVHVKVTESSGTVIKWWTEASGEAAATTRTDTTVGRAAGTKVGLQGQNGAACQFNDFYVEAL